MQHVVARSQQAPAAPGKVYIEPVEREVAAFAPATVANLGPGFDWMGCAVEVRRRRGHVGRQVAAAAVPARCSAWLRDATPTPPWWPTQWAQGEGDIVTATVLPGRPGEVVIQGIEGDGGRLSLDAPKNCVGIAAIETLKLLGQPSCGVGLRLQKGLPLGSGMGSSAASAAASAWAVNALFGSPLTKDQLIYAGLASEAAVSGYHADNIAPALMGGFILIRCAAA